ncbi:uncharacterized protein LOC126712563 isoform X2 [Quercus robur]|uniref:uncharacterized protein LOC126712563 isoform X2 n=1 Tax=Quercus robur TaxID=38942 RepID=UPI0021621E19|nr:uncharacterized protein LOC126712563 isoform X2 [Quercus robur]XP_050267889.1 uncharacterized protein LOC126712563 isoform X2 [Quercus robur]XP_050267890.1 uncharacterized protein LOC126712563 isoform X2 [Quercus robur]
MINSTLKNNGLGYCGTDLPLYRKQSPIGKKKTALRDVQNDSRSLIRNDPESCVLGRNDANAVKVSGAKRLTPEFSSNPPYHQSWRSNRANKHLTHDVKNFDSELGRTRVQETFENKSGFPNSRKYFHNQPQLAQQRSDKQEKNTSCLSAFAPIPTASLIAFSPGRPSVPIFLEKSGNGLPAAESNHLRFTSEYEVPHIADSKGSTDQKRKEQLLHVQKLLKHCDKYDQRDYIQRICHLSPLELSRHAVELEKRSIQLSVEEVKEIERMKALNIFGKSSPTKNPLPTF